MKLVLIGAGPLPGDSNKVASAAGLRTEQFLAELPADADITLILIEKSDSRTSEPEQAVDKRKCISIDKNDSRLFKRVKQAFAATKPDAVIGINTFPSYVAAKCVDDQTPLWADINGWSLAEVQAQAFSKQSNTPLAMAIAREKTIVKRADRFSVVSTAQKYALYGELALLGRLTKDTFMYPFVEVVENTCRPLTASESVQTSSSFRGKQIPEDAFLLLWLGGFNAWADAETLFKVMEKAITADGNIHLAITGGTLPGIDEQTFPEFQKRVENSSIADHIHFLSWLPKARLVDLMYESDVGLNIDRMCIETETGARNRLNEMLRFRLPLITTAGSEISRILGEHGAALVCTSGNVSDITDKILLLSKDIGERKRVSDCQETLIKTRFCATITQKPVRQWITNIQCAPERYQKGTLGKLALPVAAVGYLRTNGVRAFWRKLRQHIGT